MTCFPCLRRRRRESADQSRESGSVALPSEVFSASRPTLKEKISRISRPTLPSVEFSVPKITRPSLQGVNFRSFRGKGRDSRDSWNSSSVQIGILYLLNCIILGLEKSFILLVLTDTGEDSKLVHRRKRSKVDTLFSDASERQV